MIIVIVNNICQELNQALFNALLIIPKLPYQLSSYITTIL